MIKGTNAGTGSGERAISRRQMLVRAGQGAVLLYGGSLLAACGEDGKEGGAGAASVPTAIGARLQKLLGITPGPKSGKGVTINAGASIILSGALAALGEDHLRGLKLGLDHVLAAGGPDIKLSVRDNGFDTTKGVANVRQFAAADCPIQFSDAAATLGSELPGYQTSKIFAIDPGGSMAAYAGKPFYYMTRPTPPESYVGASSAFMRHRFPQAERWALIGSDAGTDYNNQEIKVSRSTVEGGGFTWAGDTHIAFDETNFASAFARLKQGRPDIIQVDLYGEQLGVFLKQYATSGLTAKLIGIDFTTSAGKAAGDIAEYYFANDWFDPVTPTNDWAALLVEEYKRAHGEVPFYPAAQYYQAAFIMWDVIRQVIANGGDPTATGTDAYATAVDQIPAFKSVFGGSGATPGDFQFDDRHLPKTLPCTICSVTGTKIPVPEARFNVYETELQMAK